MHWRSASKGILIGTILALTACSPAPVVTAPVPLQTIVAYATATPTAAVTPPQVNIAPTPTPHIYVVLKGDTLFDIAAKHNVTVQVLQAANPSVDPRVLVPGTELLIPAPDSTAVPAIPSPTPAAVSAGAVQCYASAAAELWCFLPVTNENEDPLENVIGAVQILDADGHVLATVDASPLLNLLPAGKSMPLVAYLQEAPKGWATAHGQVLSAFFVTGTDYYQDAQLSGTEVEISETGLGAQVQGSVQFGGEAPATVWVLAVAYDAGGSVTGVHRWERQNENEFSFWVYNLGPKIARVELLVEAHP